jgi:hypothetical protein
LWQENRSKSTHPIIKCSHYGKKGHEANVCRSKVKKA